MRMNESAAGVLHLHLIITKMPVDGSTLHPYKENHSAAMDEISRLLALFCAKSG